MSSITAENQVKTAVPAKSDLMRKLFEWGGFGAGIILVAFGVVAIVMGFSGRSTVVDSLKQEKIVGSPDMTPALIVKEAKEAGLTGVDFPTASVAGKPINSGERARTFASYMRIHALEATSGYTYAEMGRFVAKPGTPKAQLTPDGATSNPDYALIDKATKQPVANYARDIWVTETALTTALNVSYMADKLGLFGIVVGFALLLSGIGFIVLAYAALHRKRTAAAQS
jgi:F0F1-type ATP synthase membrane subunit c/vacuolar-type H+-ATPase subunit K